MCKLPAILYLRYLSHAQWLTILVPKLFTFMSCCNLMGPTLNSPKKPPRFYGQQQKHEWNSWAPNIWGLKGLFSSTRFLGCSPYQQWPLIKQGASQFQGFRMRGWKRLKSPLAFFFSGRVFAASQWQIQVPQGTSDFFTIFVVVTRYLVNEDSLQWIEYPLKWKIPPSSISNQYISIQDPLVHLPSKRNSFFVPLDLKRSSE